MKSKYILAAILVLFIVALAGISPVLATNYECYLEISQNKQQNVVVWHFDTLVAKAGFSGNDITSIHAEYHHYASGITYTLTPTQTKCYAKGVDLIFKAGSLDSLPEQRDPQKDFTYVWGTVGETDTFFAYGPGFTYRPH